MDENEDPLRVNADSIEPKKSRWLIPIAFLVAALILIGLIIFLPPAHPTQTEPGSYPYAAVDMTEPPADQDICVRVLEDTDNGLVSVEEILMISIDLTDDQLQKCLDRLHEWYVVEKEGDEPVRLDYLCQKHIEKGLITKTGLERECVTRVPIVDGAMINIKRGSGKIETFQQMMVTPLFIELRAEENTALTQSGGGAAVTIE